jgi:hypothetical protein
MPACLRIAGRRDRLSCGISSHVLPSRRRPARALARLSECLHSMNSALTVGNVCLPAEAIDPGTV